LIVAVAEALLYILLYADQAASHRESFGPWTGFN